MAKQEPTKTESSYTVEQRMSKMFIDPGNAGAVSVDIEGPDAADRNADFLGGSGGVEPRDVAPTWIGDYAPVDAGSPTDEGQLTNDLNVTDTHLATGGGDLQQ